MAAACVLCALTVRTVPAPLLRPSYSLSQKADSQWLGLSFTGSVTKENMTWVYPLMACLPCPSPVSTCLCTCTHTCTYPPRHVYIPHKHITWPALKFTIGTERTLFCIWFYIPQALLFFETWALIHVYRFQWNSYTPCLTFWGITIVLELRVNLKITHSSTMAMSQLAIQQSLCQSSHHHGLTAWLLKQGVCHLYTASPKHSPS